MAPSPTASSGPPSGSSPLGATSLPTAVLVVDDEPLILDLFTGFLRNRGLEVVTVGTGEEAVAQLAQHGFGCLLVDKNLPGIDGIAVMRIARQKQPHCACIVMTGYSSTASAIEALRLGAADYVEKPFSDLALIGQRLESAMRSCRIAYEREQLIEKLRTFQDELLHKGHALERAATEIDMFEQVFEYRVQSATEERDARIRAAAKELNAMVDGLRALVVGELQPTATRGALGELARKAEAIARKLHGRGQL